MHKRLLAIVTLLCAIPLLAFGASNKLGVINTWVRSAGGTLKVGSYPTTTSLNGSMFKSYTSSATTTLNAVITANTNYVINSLIVDGQPIQPASTTSTTIVVPAAGTSVWVDFIRPQLQFNVVAGVNGLVSPRGLQPNVFSGATYRTFSFIPARGKAVSAVTADVPGNIVYSVSALGQVDKKVIVTVSKITGNVTLTGVFSGTADTAFGNFSGAVTGTPYKAALNCDACHVSQGVDPNRAIFTAWSASAHKAAKIVCAACHQGASTGAHPGQTQCATCHGEMGATPEMASTCAHCHSPSGSIHDVGKAGKLVGSATAKCIDCHSVAAPDHSWGAKQLVKDNNGVRAITTEFNKWSHHVTGVDLQDAHCAACHLEGTVSGGAIVIDTTKHMADNFVHLRNADTDADIQWDPSAASPNHSGIDTFCMSCHDANGAASAGSIAVRALMIPAAGKDNTTATNPFADTISNRYDKLQRPAVVNVSDQFNTSNNSHHGVKGARYTGRTRAAGTRQIAAPANFANNSSALLQGTRSTIYDAGNFNALYTPLGTDGTAATGLGDDSTLHCGDCHTVGQWKAGSSDTAKGGATPDAIGAHGSNNEYMLRNTLGTDQRHTQNAFIKSTANVVTYTNPNGAFLVCYNCHAYNRYGSIFVGTGLNIGAGQQPHAGEYDDAGRCNGIGNTIPFNGYTTGAATDGSQFASRFMGLQYTTPAPYVGEQPADFGNIFGIQCANCHNSGTGNAYGGIHGSANNQNTTAATVDGTITGGAYIDGMGNTTKIERFLPGLGNAMHVPGTLGGITGGSVVATATSGLSYTYTTGGISSDTNWEQKHWQQVAGMVINNTTGAITGSSLKSAGAGCYTLGASTAATSALEGPSVTGNGGPATELLDTWGGCEDHGAKQGAGDHGFVKRIVRPVTY